MVGMWLLYGLPDEDHAGEVERLFWGGVIHIGLYLCPQLGLLL